MDSKIKKKVLKYKIEIILALFIILSISINAWWIITDNFAPRGDGLDIINEALNLYFKEDNYNITVPFLTEPPFLAQIFNHYYRLFGLYTKNELVINSIFLIIMLLGTYKLGEEIYDKKVGLASVIILNSFIMLIYAMKTNIREFHLLSFLPWTFYYMLKTNYFKNLNYSVVYGIMVGLCALIEIHFIFIIIPISIVHIWFSFSKIKSKKKTIFYRNLGFALIIAFFIGGIWYLKNIGSIIELFKYRFFVNQIEINKYNLKLFSIQYFFYYLTKLLDHIGVFYLILLFLALFRGLLKKKSNEKSLLFSAFLIPYIIIALIPLKEHIIQISLYYTIAIIIAGFIFEIKNSKIKTLLLLLIFVYAVSVISSQFTHISIHNLIIKENKVQLVRTKDTSRLLNPPIKDISIMEQSFLYTQNTSHTRFLLLSNDHTHFWDLMYFRNIHKKNYVIYSKFRLRDNKYNKWGYNTEVKGGFILDYNISDIIDNGQVEYILVFLPKSKVKDSFQVYAPSFEGIKLIENSNKYELIHVIQGNPKTPEEANQIIQIYRTIN